MATITLLPVADYPVQTTAFGPFSLAEGLTIINVKIPRCTTATPTIWPDPATTLGVTWQFSMDGGASWIGNNADGGFSAIGGIALFHGIEQVSCGVLKDLPIGTNRQVRGIYTVTGGTTRFSVTADLL